MESIKTQIRVTRDGSHVFYEGDRASLINLLSEVSSIQASIPESDTVTISREKQVMSLAMDRGKNENAIALSEHRLKFCIAAFVTVFAVLFLVIVSGRNDKKEVVGYVWDQDAIHVSS